MALINRLSLDRPIAYDRHVGHAAKKLSRGSKSCRNNDMRAKLDILRRQWQDRTTNGRVSTARVQNSRWRNFPRRSLRTAKRERNEWAVHAWTDKHKIGKVEYSGAPWRKIRASSFPLPWYRCQWRTNYVFTAYRLIYLIPALHIYFLKIWINWILIFFKWSTKQERISDHFQRITNKKKH